MLAVQRLAEPSGREEGTTVDVQQLLDGARDVLTVRRVFGEPYERDGLSLIPVARVKGGGGGGQGDGSAGSGGGFGVSARPAGVFVIAGSTVRWEPALDLNQIIVGAQVVAVVALLAARAITRRHPDGAGQDQR